MDMSNIEAEPNRMHRLKTTFSSRVDAMAESLFASKESLVANPEDFPQPQRLVLKAMKVLGLGGLALLIPDEKASPKSPLDPKS